MHGFSFGIVETGLQIYAVRFVMNRKKNFLRIVAN